MVPSLRLQLMMHGALLVLTVNGDLMNIAHVASISATPESTYKNNDYRMAYAVDGRIETNSDNIDNCGCCYASSDANDLFFTASFSGHYDVQKIEVIGRQTKVSEYPEQSLSGIVVYLDNVAVHVEYDSSTNRATITTTSTSVQTIRITRPQSGGQLLVVCEIYVMVSVTNIAQAASVTASSALVYGIVTYALDQVVDGRFDGNADTCGCCYSSRNLQFPFLQADLQQPISVLKIVIDGRKDKKDAESVLTGVTVTLDGSLATPAPGRTINHMVVIPTFPVQVIRVERNATRPAEAWYLMICELQVFVANCVDGFYGNECTTQCPQNCATNCDFRNGRCESGCEAGFSGHYCNISCSAGTFGPNCVHQCHCKDNAPCKTTSGQCVGTCAAGWTGPTCSQACNDGRYGENCTHTCRCMKYTACDKVQGNCSEGCDYGWTGFNCSTECSGQSGMSFGDKCSQTCHCADGKPCDKVSGTCQSPGCLPGWFGASCDQACRHSSFGSNCSARCHCLRDAHCNNVDGTCENHLCDAGWRLDNCSQVCLHGTYGYNCSTECHCLSDAECDHVSGACPGGMCAPGWQQESCSQGFSKSPGLFVPLLEGMIGAGVIVGVIMALRIAVLCLCLRRRSCGRSDGKTSDAPVRCVVVDHETEMQEVAFAVSGERNLYESPVHSADISHIYTGLAEQTAKDDAPRTSYVNDIWRYMQRRLR